MQFLLRQPPMGSCAGEIHEWAIEISTMPGRRGIVAAVMP